MYETTWYVGGREIFIESEYMGVRTPPWDSRNAHHSIITVTVDEVSEQFDAWGSAVRTPSLGYDNTKFEDEYSLKNVFQSLCNDVLYEYWDDWDDIIDGLSGSEAIRVVDAIREQAEQFKRLNLYDEDLLLEIVNDEDWH